MYKLSVLSFVVFFVTVFLSANMPQRELQSSPLFLMMGVLFILGIAFAAIGFMFEDKTNSKTKEENVRLQNENVSLKVSRQDYKTRSEMNYERLNDYKAFIAMQEASHNRQQEMMYRAFQLSVNTLKEIAIEIGKEKAKALNSYAESGGYVEGQILRSEEGEPVARLQPNETRYFLEAKKVLDYQQNQ